mgnify:CR=1 FL=1|tara:strand:+ start:567 stop:2066 length:1500 start_codon:yes stop_codon:yes gene_type:complete
MATLLQQVQDITGSSNAKVDDYLNRGANFVSASLPRHLLWAFTEETSFASSRATIASWASNGGDSQLTSNGHGFELTDRILISGSSSNDGIYIPTSKATNTITIPKAYVAQAVPGYVFKLTKFDTNGIHSVRRNQYPAERASEEDRGLVLDSSSLSYPSNNYPKYIVEADSVIPVPFPDGKDEGKVIHLSAPDYGTTPFSYGEYDHIIVKYAAALDFTAKASSTAPAWTDISVPVVPTPPDLGSDLSITSVSPVIPSIDDISVTLPTNTPSYISPVLSISTFSKTFPSFTTPVMGALDYTSVDTSLTEEDPELVGSKLAKINAQVSEFTANMRGNLEKFQSSQADYNQEFAEYQFEVTNNFKEWAQNYTIAQQKFNEENVVYQSELQKAIKDSDLDLNTKAQELQKFQSEMSLYTQNINNEIKEHMERIAKAREEWAQSSAKYQAELNKYSGEIQHNVQKVTNDSRNAQQYSSSATTYFGLAINSIKSVLDILPQVSSE